MMDGSFSLRGMLENRTPGTTLGSMQWSPPQALTLSSKTVASTFPVTESQETR